MASDPATGRVLVFRGLKGGVAPALAYHSEDAVTGPVDAFDTTGDGTPRGLVRRRRTAGSRSRPPSTLASD
jgi:hypothetical protein